MLHGWIVNVFSSGCLCGQHEVGQCRGNIFDSVDEQNLSLAIRRPEACRASLNILTQLDDDDDDETMSTGQKNVMTVSRLYLDDSNDGILGSNRKLLL